MRTRRRRGPAIASSFISWRVGKAWYGVETKSERSECANDDSAAAPRRLMTVRLIVEFLIPPPELPAGADASTIIEWSPVDLSFAGAAVSSRRPLKWTLMTELAMPPPLTTTE